MDFLSSGKQSSVCLLQKTTDMDIRKIFHIIYVWIFENGVNVNTSTLTLFPENMYTGFFLQSTTDSLSTHSLATHLSGV